jgi:nitrogen fixation/metabolism regulation signal transduction histidine kinase
MRTLSPKSNFENKVRNTKLPRTKPLMPLFEVISNSIHAINEAKEKNLLSEDAIIKVKLLRNGDEETLRQLPDIDEYPIHSIEVTDNGIGLNDENLNYFVESDTDHKIKIGGKGVGRFVCLKAFSEMRVRSCCIVNDEKLLRKLLLKLPRKGFMILAKKKLPVIAQ